MKDKLSFYQNCLNEESGLVVINLLHVTKFLEIKNKFG